MANLKKIEIKQAVILAGGKGERLRPLTNDRPKPMVLVNGRPFLEYLIERLRENGITEVVLLLGYLPEKITGHFGDGSAHDISIKYHIGAIDDETGTRLRNAKHLLKDNFLLLYSDNYWPLELKKMSALYAEKGVLASTTVYCNKDGGAEYGPENNIAVSDDSLVLKYDKERKDKALNGVDIGFFIIDKKVISLMPEHNFSFEKEILPQLVSQNQLAAFCTDSPYYWMTTPESVKIMEKVLEPKKVVFLDRDGVINEKAAPHAHIKNWSEFKFLPGVKKAIKLLTEAGCRIFIITNQRGLAVGSMTVTNLADIHKKMEEEIQEAGGEINGIYYCPHNDEDGCDCRKPKPGLFFRAARDNRINLADAIFVGDSNSDMKAGEAAGVKTILTGPGFGLLEISRTLL